MAMPGYAIHALDSRPDPALLARMAVFPTPIVSDCLGRTRGAVGLQKYHRAGAMIGPAFTVKTRPGDNLMVHKALDMAAPGDIVVVDGGGDLSNALVGDLMMTYAIQRRLGGFVIGGAVRDLPAYLSANFPCFAQGSIHRGPYKDGPGEINVPVSVGGMTVAPGDVVIGDDDGVVAFPADQLETMIAACAAKTVQEDADREAILADRWDRSWVEALLTARGLQG